MLEEFVYEREQEGENHEEMFHGWGEYGELERSSSGMKERTGGEN